MTYVDWKLKMRKLASCSCSFGCPCEFNGPPTRGYCEGVEAFEIIEGYFAHVRLDGLRGAGMYRWPGPVHEGHGAYLAVIDERATQEQREALGIILSGQEQEPTTGFNIYASTIEHDLGMHFAPIEFEWDLENRAGRMRVPGLMEASYAPIRNPVTGAKHFASIKLPQGFEFREAEAVSSAFRSEEPIKQQYEEVYGFITLATYGPYGIIEEESYPLAR